MNNNSKCNSRNISNLNRSEKKKKEEKFTIKRNLIKNKYFNNQQKEPLKIKIRKVLGKIKYIEEQNHKKTKSSYRYTITNCNNNKEKYCQNINVITNKNNNTDRKKENRNNHITINNNYYTIINNMTINDINGMDKINKNISFLKIDDYYHNYNSTNYRSQTSKKESKSFFIISTNKNIRSRNQSSSLNHYKDNSNICFNNKNIKYKFGEIINKNQNKNKYNKSINEKRTNEMNNSAISHKKKNNEVISNKNLSLKEKIHLFQQKKEALVKQYQKRNLERKAKNKNK